MKPTKNIVEVVQKEMPEFADECNSLSVSDLESRLSQCAKDTEATRDAKEGDEELEEAQACATGLGAPYRDAIKALRLKSRYLIALIKEKGGQ